MRKPSAQIFLNVGAGELQHLWLWEIHAQELANFCSVNTGNPKGWLDKDEPEKIAKTVQEMGIRYVVLTCVTRDDLSDGGAQHFAETVKAIKSVEQKHRS